ncbi:hypothetical protein [Variovorax sp. tm]|uniref:hypothetical protein n=1 Tax=Variovorax atrisoli TaxID=3394203 RepID=UPI003A81014E
MTTSPQPESPEPLKVVATTPHDWIWEFLDGSAGYMGVFFGEKHPNHQGRYWWRHFLRQEVEAMRKNLSDAEAAIQAARNEAEAMRADAERYRWLLAKHSTCKAGDEMNPAVATVSFTRFYPGSIGERPSLSTAIDDDVRTAIRELDIAMKGDAHA